MFMHQEYMASDHEEAFIPGISLEERYLPAGWVKGDCE